MLTAVSVCATAGLTACGTEDDEVVVSIGYQSKTINTVNAGTLLRSLGTFEAALNELGERDGKSYSVEWLDFSSGSPLTAQMIASQIDIGSMGDYPLLVNGSKNEQYGDSSTSLIAVTGYNMAGSLNQVLVPTGSTASSLEDLRGKKVSTSLGSAADGMLNVGLSREGMSADDVQVVNQDPSIGAAALESGQTDAYAQFVPWPQIEVFRGKGRLLYDGGSNEIPTFHGVVVRDSFAEENTDVVTAFVDAMSETTTFLEEKPLEAAELVAEATGLEPEVIYLYNGPAGLVSFDMSLKDELVGALEENKPFLVAKGSVDEEYDIPGFIDESFVREQFGPGYDEMKASTENPSRLTGHDEVCGLPVSDQGTASEVWFAGEEETTVSATPSCLLSRIARSPQTVRAAYVPDASNGLHTFAEHATWLRDPAGGPTDTYLPFATVGAAEAYLAENPDLERVEYDQAVSASRSVN